MTSQYDIDPDFKRFPVFTLKFGAITLWFINHLMKMQCFFTKRALKLSLKEHTIARSDTSKMRVLMMTPANITSPAPALIYYHGGGFGITYSSLHLQNCERYAKEAGCVVFFVAYRLAPQAPFPAGFDDSYLALEWLVKEAGNLGIDRKRIAVGGDSAGGALAAGVAQKARDTKLVTLCGQLLIYPVLDHTCSTQSATEFTDVPLWNAKSNKHMWDMYLGNFPGEVAPTYAAPGHGVLHDLPSAFVETAEFDPLRDEGIQYISELKKHGTAVTTNETKRTIHGYDGNAKSAIAQRSMLKRIAFLQHSFN